MGLGEHGDILPLLCIVMELFDELLQQRIIHILQGLLDTQGYTGVVDILRSKSEVDEFLEALNIIQAHRIQFLLDKILYGFDIVVGYSLDILYALRIGWRKLTVNISQVIKQAMVEIHELGKRKFTEGDEILYLYTYTVSDKCIL
jgi:hypothetical protein